MKDNSQDAVEDSQQAEDVLSRNVEASAETVAGAYQAKYPGDSEEEEQDGDDNDVMGQVELQLVLNLLGFPQSIGSHEIHKQVEQCN